MKTKSLILTGCLMACMVCPTAFAQDDYPKFDFFAGYSLMKTAEYDNIDRERTRLANSLSQSIGGNRPVTPKKSSFLEKGFSTTLTYNFTSIVGLDTSLRYNTGSILRASGKVMRANLPEEINFDAGYRRTRVAFLVGPRFTFRSDDSRITPFLYGLAGLSHDGLSGTYDLRSTYDDYWWEEDNFYDCWDDVCSDNSVSIKTHNSFGVALGGGFDISINNNWAIRAIQVDYFIASHPKYLGNAENIRNKRYDNINMSIGVVYRFGK